MTWIGGDALRNANLCCSAGGVAGTFSSMIRTTPTLALLAFLLLGFAFGWFLWLWLSGAVFSPSMPAPGTEAPVSKSPSRAGYCCTTVGTACEQVADPGLCFRGGGKAFNALKTNCDYYCLNVKS